MIFQLKALDIICDITLRVYYCEIIFINEVEFQIFAFWIISLESMHHILIFKLGVRSIFIDNCKQRSFVTEQSDNIIICWRADVLNLLLEAVFSQNDHLVLENISIVLFQKFLISKINAKLL